MLSRWCTAWPDTYCLWDAQVDFLKATHRCIRFTLPGFDETQPRKPYTVDEVTEVLSFRDIFVNKT